MDKPVDEVVLMAGDDLVLGGSCMEYNPEVKHGGAKESVYEGAWCYTSEFAFSCAPLLPEHSCVHLTSSL